MAGYCGSTYDLDLTLSTKLGPVDLTNYVLEMDVVPANGTPTVILTTQNAGLIVNTPTAGTVHVHITSAQTTSLGEGAVAFNLWNKASDASLLAIGTENFLTIPDADTQAETNPIPPVIASNIS